MPLPERKLADPRTRTAQLFDPGGAEKPSFTSEEAAKGRSLLLPPLPAKRYPSPPFFIPPLRNVAKCHKVISSSGFSTNAYESIIFFFFSSFSENEARPFASPPSFLPLRESRNRPLFARGRELHSPFLSICPEGKSTATRRFSFLPSPVFGQRRNSFLFNFLLPPTRDTYSVKPLQTGGTDMKKRPFSPSFSVRCHQVASIWALGIFFFYGYRVDQIATAFPFTFQDCHMARSPCPSFPSWIRSRQW